jgi:superfamily II DNA helicase RecQ
VEKTDGQLGRWGLMKTLRGQRSKKLAKYEFDHIDEYGSLTDMPKEAVLEHIDYMIERGCLAVTSFFFPMLRLTEIGQKRLDEVEREVLE